MKEALLPKSFLDFADALRMLAQSSLDATEVVTKWAQLMNTTTPEVVTVTVNGTTWKVDNLAKMRMDLASGLSVETPTVKRLDLRSYQSRGSVSPGGYDGMNWLDAGGNPYEDGTGWVGVYTDVYNDFHSVCMPVKREVDAEFLRLPRAMMLGTVRTPGGYPQDTLKLRVAAPSASYAQVGTLANTSYYCTVLFLNRNAGRLMPDGTPEHAEGLPFTLELYDNKGNLLYNKILSPWKSVKLFLFAAPGQDTVNVQEVIYDR